MERRGQIGPTVLAIGLAVAMAPCAGLAQMKEPPLNDKYHVSDAEREACSGDAVRLCSDAYPDEDALIACMKAKHQQLGVKCRVVFDLGLKRRHL